MYLCWLKSQLAHKSLFLVILFPTSLCLAQSTPVAMVTPGTLNLFAGGGSACSSATDSVGDGCPATQATLNNPKGAAVDAFGNIYIADVSNNRIRVICTNTKSTTNNFCNGLTAGNIYNFAGTGSSGYSGDSGLAINAELHYPSALAFDPSGKLYIADNTNNRVRVVSTSGIITTCAGTGTATPTPASSSNSGDGGSATAATFNGIAGLATDASGNLYISGNAVVREVNAQTGIISLVAGNYVSSSTDSGDGTAATSVSLGEPMDIAVDSNNNLLIPDYENGRVRSVNLSTGIISTVIGSGSSTPGPYGGQATKAGVRNPRGIKVDGGNNRYLADGYNYRAERIDPGGIITLLAGDSTTQTDPATGIGAVATSADLGIINEALVDANGNLFIVDNSNNEVYEVAAFSAGLSFSTTAIGSTSASQTITVTNTGTANLVLSSISFPAQFAKGTSSGPYSDCTATTTLSAGGSCQLGVEYTPTALGSVNSNLVIGSNTTNGSIAIALSGNATPTYTSTTTLTSNLTNVNPGQAVTLTAQVSGAGAKPTGTVSFTSTGTGANQGKLGTAALANGVATYYGLVWVGQDQITATYTPDANSLLLYSSSTSPAVSVTNAPITGALTLNWPFLNWAQPIATGGSSGNWPVTLTNLTGVSLPTPAISISSPANANFTISTGTCNSALAIGASCLFNVAFTPTIAGSQSGIVSQGTLTVTAGSYSTTPITVSGTAISSGIFFNWPFLDFSNVVFVGANSAPWPVTLTNQSHAITFPTPAVTFSDGSFTTTNSTCDGATIPSMGTCSFNVIFSPLAADVTGSSAVRIAGTMTASAGSVSGSLNVDGLGAAASLAVNWPFLDFGPNNTHNVLSCAWPVTVTNNTGVTQTISVVTPSNFVHDADAGCANALAPGQSCVFDVYFSPTAVTTYSGNTTITGSVIGTTLLSTRGQANQ
jgi:hypothetical protein